LSAGSDGIDVIVSADTGSAGLPGTSGFRRPQSPYVRSCLVLARVLAVSTVTVLSRSLLPSATGAGHSDEKQRPRCAGRVATVVGTAGDDEIDLSSRRRPQVVVAKGGDDLVYGTMYTDRICGGPSNDRLFTMDGRDILKGGPGTDRFPDSGKRIVGGPGADRIYLHTGDRVTVLGGKGIDHLWYADRDDTCRSIERWHYSSRGC